MLDLINVVTLRWLVPGRVAVFGWVNHHCTEPGLPAWARPLWQAATSTRQKLGE